MEPLNLAVLSLDVSHPRVTDELDRMLSGLCDAMDFMGTNLKTLKEARRKQRANMEDDEYEYEDEDS